MSKIFTGFVFFVSMVVLFVSSDVRANNTHKLLNSQEWPKTWDKNLRLINLNIQDIREHLNGSPADAFVPARNIVISIRALQNLSRLEKYLDTAGNIDLAKALVVASRLANALKSYKTELARETLEELNDILNK